MDNDERNRNIAQDYLKGLNARELKDKYGVSIPLVYKVLAEQGATGPNAPERNKDLEKSRVLSKAHVKLGLRLYEHRQFTVGETRISAALTFNWTSKKIALVEKGETELTLMELIKMANYMRLSLPELVTDLWPTGEPAYFFDTPVNPTSDDDTSTH